MENENLKHEIENFQKDYFDNVRFHYEMDNQRRGDAALASWEDRFKNLLVSIDVKLENRYQKVTKTRGQRLFGRSVLQNFQATRGEAIEAFLEQLIVDVEGGEFSYSQSSQMEDNIQAESSATGRMLFISHSSVDTPLAEKLVDLIRSALSIPADEILCTSVEGYRLKGGEDTDEKLRGEIISAQIVIGLISAASMESAYVLFELGARWGTKRSLIPLLANGVKPESLKGPIRGFNAHSCDSSAQLHQLLGELSIDLSVSLESPATYQKHIDKILENIAVELSQNVQIDTLHEDALVFQHASGYEGAETAIEDYCRRQWPEDFEMQLYCQSQQSKALDVLRRGRPGDVPEEIFNRVRQNCEKQWPDDFEMREYCEANQFEAYRKLNEK